MADSDLEPLFAPRGKKKRIIRALVRALRPIQGSGDCKVTDGPSGVNIHVPPRQRGGGAPFKTVFFVELNNRGSSTGSFIGTEVRVDGTSPDSPRTWDGSSSSAQFGDIILPKGKSAPRWLQPVEVRRAIDSNQKEIWFVADEGPFPAIITGNASLGTNRWKYAWSEAEFNGDSLSALTGGRSGSTSGNYATNLAEVNHGTYAWGVDTSGGDYSDTNLSPRPVGGGGTDNTHKYNVPVWMYEYVDSNGALKHYFALMGSHDGSCS